ncbi:MAG: glycosyltransferase family 2 protein [Bdellovibrionota bacterium]
MKPAITAAIITYNEEARIERCLSSLLWTNEILVVDAFSKDKTPDLCLSKTAPWATKIKFTQRPWDGFRSQRNYALSEASNDWLLVVDADEQCTAELASSIQTMMTRAGGPEKLAYKVRRVEYFLGKPIKYGIWNPSYQDRFFHRGGVKYINDVHEYPVFCDKPGYIHEPLLHFPEFSPHHFLEKMNKYTTIEAKDRILAGQRTNCFKLAFAFPAMFLKNFFYYKAYRDGMHGFIISLLEGVSRVVRHVKMWQIQNKTARH